MQGGGPSPAAASPASAPHPPTSRASLLSDSAVHAALTVVTLVVLLVAGWIGYRVHGSLGALTGLAIGGLVLGVGWMLLVLTGTRELVRIWRRRRLADAGREVRTRG